MKNEKEILNGHIFPFLWTHGEKKEQIFAEIKAIRDANIKMFCVESRPHPDFCGERWWKELGFILETAKNFGMKVWLLDDKHYPSGYANGAIERHPELKQKFLKSHIVDFYGDGDVCRFVTDIGEDERFLTAFVYKRGEDDLSVDLSSAKEINDFRNNVLTLEKGFTGYFRLLVLSVTARYALRENFIDMLDEKSCSLMIEEIYKPHYEHFKDYFGNTFVGFFSDEPRFMNGRAEQSFPANFYGTKVGDAGVVYPWREDLFDIIGRPKGDIISLWTDGTDDAYAEYRIAYMNFVTRLYQKNFSEALGKWCEEKGVLYTGHIVEDSGNHCRLGTGAGHYFRSMTGQHISGIDVVLHQLEKDSGDKKHYYCGPTVLSDRDFFRFTLAKLGVSSAHLEEKKKDRAMCEIFGAYGWGESINQMKWLVDFMLVRGINYFVPHAFDPKTDDTDCPPYFYLGGENPMYSAFGCLMNYTETLSRELSLPYSVKVAVLYHAEAEWSGKEFTPMDAICKVLTENQIDFEIVPIEYLSKTEAEILIVPYAKYYGQDAEKAIKTFRGKVIRSDKDAKNILKEIEFAREYRLKIPNKNIRVLKRGEKYFVFNEGVTPVSNVLYGAKGEEYGFSLLAGESYLFENGKIKPDIKGETAKISDKCEIYVKRYDRDEYVKTCIEDYTIDINGLAGYKDFWGKIKYIIRFEAKDNVGKTYLDFGEIVGGLKITLNRKGYSELFGVPYVIDVSDAIKCGENELTVELSTTLALKYKDRLSAFSKIDQVGLRRPIKVIKT